MALRSYLDRARVGEPEYWVIDLDARLVERWRPGDERPAVLTDRLVWRPGPATAGFQLDLPTLFSAVLEKG